MVTTNVSQNQPFELPFERNGYLFKTEEMLRIFPPKIVKHLIRTSYRHYKIAPPPGYHYLPEKKDFPVAVAMRMSLSFPVLLSAVRLYTVSRHAWREAKKTRSLSKDDLLPNWFSDGGISSNFPIHFFDGWLPSRPTFGINLTAVPEKRDAPQLAHSGGSQHFEAGESPVQNSQPEEVVLPRANHYPAVEVHRLEQLVSFLGAIFSTSQNYRDNMQSTLPSYRERIVQVRLAKDEGGLNLDMPASVLKKIVEKGKQAGEVLVSHYDEGRGFEQHRWVRYLVLMNLLEKELTQLQQWLKADQVEEAESPDQEVDGSRNCRYRFGTVWAQRDANGDDETKFPYPRRGEWCDQAEALTTELTTFLESWAPRLEEALKEQGKGRVAHFSRDSPKDEPVLRVVPRI